MGKVRETVAKAAGTLKKAGSAIAGDKGLIRELKQDHGEVSALMMQVKAGDEDVRMELYPQIRRKLLAHAHAEQREVYEVLERYAETRGQITHSIKEHTQIEELMHRLDALPIDGEEWGRVFTQLMETVKHHVAEEENELLPKAEKLLSDEQFEAIEQRFLQEKERLLNGGATIMPGQHQQRMATDESFHSGR